MDDLLQYCMRELAFDGDLGCDVSRLRHFIEAFYFSQDPPGIQNVDDSFHAFVWSLLVQQSSVRIGLMPQGSTVEVFVAPQPGKRKRAANVKNKALDSALPAHEAKDAQADEAIEADLASGRLQVIDSAATTSLDELVHEYGNGLRVAVDPETSFNAITGSHSRPAKLTPMVYTALQLISRGRESGLSVIDLGKKSGYDQKTCFYLIKQLCDLDLIVKLSKGGPGGGNFCVHKYFFKTSAFWEGVRREGGVEAGIEDTEQAERDRDGEGSADTRRSLQFDPIDSRHLTSIQLIKSRLSRLLKNSENGLHLYQNLLVTLGFANPTKSDRRCFIVRIRELIKEGFIEKVVVPGVRGPHQTLCIRLVEDGHVHETDNAIVQPIDVGDEEQEVGGFEDTEPRMPVVNLTIHRQILKLLEEAGHAGLTLNDISIRLGNLDRRTAELLLSRLERIPPPTHLSDLAICDFLENQGRERRHRYYTIPGYFSFINRENIDHTGRTTQYTSRDFSHSGEFCPLPQNLFYPDLESLVTHEDSHSSRTKPPKGGGTRKIGRPRKSSIVPKSKNGVLEENGETLASKPRKVKMKPTMALQGGRESESQEGGQEISRERTKRRRNEDFKEGEDSTRPLKKKKVDKKKPAATHSGHISDGANVEVPTLRRPPTRRRGRPPKKAKADLSYRTSSAEAADGENWTEYDQKTGLEPELEPMLSRPSSSVIHELAMTANGQSDNAQTSHISKQYVTNLDVRRTTEHSVVFSLDKSAVEGGNSTFINASSTESSQKSGPQFAIDTIVGSKREYDSIKDDVAENGTSSKRLKSERSQQHGLVNISQMRAENEFMRVVRASGGIANTSTKEFLDTHAQVIAKMADAGESTSMPVGTQPDRRTIRKILDRLEERGRLKTLTVTLPSRVGQFRPVKVVYESGVTQEELDQFLASLRQEPLIPTNPVHKRLEQPTGYTRPKPRRTRDVLLTQDGHLEGGNEKENWRRDLDLSELDNDSIRSTMLSEVQTVAQLYGYMVGRARRARELHQFSLAHLQDMNHSPYVVSPAERIIAFPYYLNDLPVSTYFTLISATRYNAELSALMETQHGRLTLVKDLSMELHDELQIGRARARDQIFGLLAMLTSLKLVTPLQQSTSKTPLVICVPNGDYPSSFDLASIAETKRAPSLPLYWRFNTIAPIYMYSKPEPWPPPFHRDMFVRTADESMSFWLELEDASLRKEYVYPETSMDSITGSCACTLEEARALRRRHSWVSSYVLTWSQKQYLHRWTEPSTGYTPLCDEDGGRACLEHICSLLSAPLDAVHQFFNAAHSMFTKNMRRIRAKKQKIKEKNVQRKATEGRALLSKKAAEARRQLETDWDALVLRAHPDPIPYGSATRLKQLRMRYLQSRASMDNLKWEASILEAIAESRSGKRNPALANIASSIPKPPRQVGISRLAPLATSHQKSVEELIEQQKERAVAFQAIPQKKKSKETSTGGSGLAPAMKIDTPRRQRFQWTSEYDDLARDASAIIRSRCRTLNRMDWTALDQLFPFLPRNNVRQRIATLRQEAGGESYLRLLEDKWHELWIEHRGTDALPDDSPNHPSEFDVIAHVEFLRRYIDKRALRVGLPYADMQSAVGAILTENISDFYSKWRMDETPHPSSKMDVVWTAVGDEHREKAFLGEAFSLARSSPDDPNAPIIWSNGIAESGLKMALSTSEGDYDTNNATLFLNSIGQDAIRKASEDLLERGVVSETGKGRRKGPGRKLKITSLNEDALRGSFHSDFYAEACTTEDMFEDDANDWRSWSSIASDGEMAALTEFVSAGKVEFQIDVSGPASHRQQLDWNSKKVDDDQITTVLSLRFHSSTLDESVLSDGLDECPVPLSISAHTEETRKLGHGQNCGEPAPCRKTSSGIITCSACLSAEQDTFLAHLEQEDRELSSELIERLDSAGWQGLRREALMLDSPWSHLPALIDRMTSGSAPQCYWVGYTVPVLVGGRHIRKWTVSIPGLSMPRLVFPRRWINLRGERMQDLWNAGVRAVVGVLLARPGIPQSELSRQLISTYDRQELDDLLHHLCTEGLITRRVAPENPDLQFNDIRAMDAIEEQQTCWALTWNAWYRVNTNE